MKANINRCLLILFILITTSCTSTDTEETVTSVTYDPYPVSIVFSELSAEIVQQRDLTLALLCDNKIDVTFFSTVSSTDSQNYSTVAPDLLFRQNGCVIASDILVTTK